MEALLWLFALTSLVVALVGLTNAATAMRRVRELEARVAELAAQQQLPLERGEEPVQPPAEPAISLPEEAPASEAEAPWPAGEASPPMAGAAPATQTDRVERAIGLVWATRIGAILLLLGVLFFFKVAIERNWLGPWARVGLGVAAGLVCIAIAARFRRRLHARWIGVMVGIGLAILLASLWAAHSLYALVPGWVAFAALSVFAVGAGALAFAWDLEAILVSASALGFVNLAALSGSFPGHALFMTYGVALGGAVLFAALRRGWALAAMSVPAGLLPALVSRHFGPPELLDAAFGPALPTPGGLDTVLGLALACGLAVAFVLAARRLLSNALAPLLLPAAAVALPLALAGMLIGDRLTLEVFVAGLALVVALERRFFGARPGSEPLDTLHLAMHLLGGLALVLSVSRGARDVELAPMLVFTLVGLASAFTAARERELAAWEIVLLAGWALIWSAVHRHWESADPMGVILLVATAAALAIGLARDRRGAERDEHDPVTKVAVIGVVLSLVLAVFRCDLAPPWTTVLLAALALALAAGTRAGRPWLFQLALAVLSLALTVSLAVDVPLPTAMRNDFITSEGVSGAFFPPLFIGPRALSLLALALTALAFRAAVGRRPAPATEPADKLHAGIRVTGFVLALAYLVDQTFLVVHVASVPSRLLAARDIDALLSLANHDLATVLMTAVTALFGAGVLAWGFIARSRLDRWVGLVAIALALLELVTIDLAIMDGVARTIVLVGFGALLLASGFLYARLRPRLESLLGPSSDAPPDADATRGDQNA